ncbi:hypothetical protein T484DRAFT_1757553, partial [Baffinella frigidus]
MSPSYLEDFRIYNRILTTNEIDDIMNTNPHYIDHQFNLGFWYKFTEDVIHTSNVFDYGPTKINATIENATTSNVSTYYGTFDNHMDYLIVWYKFDDATTIGLDSSGNGKYLTPLNTPIANSASNKTGTSCVELNGSNYFNITYNDDFNRNTFT